MKTMTTWYRSKSGTRLARIVEFAPCDGADRVMGEHELPRRLAGGELVLEDSVLRAPRLRRAVAVEHDEARVAVVEGL